jgi:GAF domain-containing protein
MTNKKRISKPSKGIDPELITSLYEISTAINALTEVDEIAAIIIDHCLKRIDAEQGMVYLLDKSENDGDMFKTFLRGYSHRADIIPFHINQSLAAIILKNRSVMLCNSPDSDKLLGPLKLTGYGINSILSAPLITRQGMIGILILVNNSNPEGFTDHDKRFLNCRDSGCESNRGGASSRRRNKADCPQGRTPDCA